MFKEITEILSPISTPKEKKMECRILSQSIDNIQETQKHTKGVVSKNTDILVHICQGS